MRAKRRKKRLLALAIARHILPDAHEAVLPFCDGIGALPQAVHARVLQRRVAQAKRPVLRAAHDDAAVLRQRRLINSGGNGRIRHLFKRLCYAAAHDAIAVKRARAVAERLVERFPKRVQHRKFEAVL